MKPLSALVGMVTGAIVTTFGLGNAASAADFSLRGTFAQDDNVQLFDFSVSTTSAVTFRTYSYAGGTQADGTVITGGGFDPVLTLFDGNGYFLASNDDDDSGTVAKDPQTGQGYDSLLNLMLAAGNYTVALTQFGNFTNSANLADGFRQEGNGNFTSDFSRCTTDTPFCDFTGNLRTNQWAFDALGVRPLLEADEDVPDEPVIPSDPVTPSIPVIPIPNEPGDEATQVPEPTATVAIALAGMLAMAKRRRNK
ncbi:PEP-CTERM sorting domain-containing protein [Leptolyngbya cf. ectocarpi LEGE 11479]|uniref:PEP-CTERM sorting domain-containing protein n=1 Tax=Leptolyngbya cf. ectocarpi LEGE 11479 TaxID=1828722 RepID=A0A929F9I6_LEPEC|nr:DVUA0089 family protein [Leptolyngbya ectocarpi]MBE9069396.1 PEP-CTERM sorting domain-containing protein [Leptolyngbya cf. ectocarpi LEGE 11479]